MKVKDYEITLLYNKNYYREFLTNPINIKLSNNIATNAYGCSLDNIFIIFESKSYILYLIYSSLNKSIIAFNLNKMQIVCEIKKAHNDYIDNFRHIYDLKNKRDIILSLSSGDNNIKIWDINNWNCIHNINNIYKVGIILSACFLINEMDNFIITCNCFLYNIIVIDFEGNKIKEFPDSSNYTIFIDTYFDIQKNKYYIITGNKNNVKSYDFNTNNLYYTYEDKFSSHHRSVIINNNNDDEIIKIIFPSEEGFISIFNFHSGNILNKINFNHEALLSLCLWNNDFLFVGGRNKTINLINLKKGEIVKKNVGHNHWICSIKKVDILNFGECLITQGLDNKIKLWAINNE